jgi:hypothetical protein
MSTVTFDRDEMAKWYAKQHIQTDPGIDKVYYLRKGAPDREIRFVEINRLLADLKDDALEPLDFGVDTGAESEHKLVVLDVTPAQWDAIEQGTLPLPGGWTLEDAEILDSARR